MRGIFERRSRIRVWECLGHKALRKAASAYHSLLLPTSLLSADSASVGSARRQTKSTQAHDHPAVLTHPMEQVARHTATLHNDKTLRLFCGTSTFICFQLLSHPPAYSSPSPDLFSHSPSRIPLLQSQFPLLTVPPASLYCSHSSLSSQSLPHPSTAVTVPSPHSPSRIPLPVSYTHLTLPTNHRV